MFLGTHTPKADEKGRIILPAKFRPGLAEGVVLTKGQDRSLVLIDTPGHSPKDAEVQTQLKGFLEELPEVETHLVLSATTKPRDLVDIVQRFEGLKPGRLIFTKLDETSTYGPMLSTLVRIKRPLSYLGTGQEVPDDLELATSRRVADLILPPPMNLLERPHD